MYSVSEVMTDLTRLSNLKVSLWNYAFLGMLKRPKYILKYH